jgi:hypothetical protein
MVTKRIERAVVKAFGAAGASAFIKDLGKRISMGLPTREETV